MSAILKLNNNDVPEVERFLAPHAESSMFLRSNMARAGLEYKDEDYAGEYWAVFDGENIKGILAHYWNGNVMMQCPEVHDLLQLTSYFLSKKTRKVKGILGLEEQAALVVDILDIPKEDFTLNNTEGLFSLDLNKLALPDLDGFETICPSEMDQDLLFEWMRDYDIEALGYEDGPALYEHINQRISRMKDGTILTLVHEGEPVSLAGCNARVGDMNQIGPVWTPPGHRGKGYARRAVAMLLNEEKDAGINRSILFTNNKAAEKAYKSLGYARIAKYRLALLK